MCGSAMSQLVITMGSRYRQSTTQACCLIAQMPVEESVSSQLALLTAADAGALNGRFVDWKGDDMPW